jgi:peptide/nickel transport system substrate-binding protein
MLYFAPDHTDSSQYVQYFGLLKGSQWQTWAKTDVSTEQTDLLSKAFAEQDTTKRADIYNQLATSMIADNVIIPVVNPDLFLAARSDIKGLYYSACCNLVLSDLSRG